MQHGQMDQSQLQQYIEQLEGKVASLMRLVEISAVLNSTLKLKPLLSTIMDSAAEIVDAEAGSVLLWDAKSQELRFAATTTGDSGDKLIGKPVPLEGSIAGTILRENRVVVVDDVRRDPRHYKKTDKDSDFQTRSVLGVPMRSKARVIGVLEAVNKRKLPWTQDDVNYMTILAAQAAVAIESAQLVSALQKANDELSHLDKMKSDFIAIASHELRTPLGVILGYASFLQDSTDEDVRSLASKVVNSALQLRRIIEDLTNLRYLEQKATDLGIEKIVLGEFLHSAIHDVRELAEAKRHNLVFNEPPPHLRVAIDTIRMGMAITNILNNALRFTPDDGTITIDSEVRGQQVAVMIHDNGLGIAKEDLERIFERFVQVEDHMTRTNGGMGIGLSIARALVEAHGGKVWASSPGLNQGSTFTITMPLVGKNAEE